MLNILRPSQNGAQQLPLILINCKSVSHSFMYPLKGIAPEEVQEVYMGNVVQAMGGQAPARQAALFAGTFCGSLHSLQNHSLFLSSVSSIRL